jgi:succinate dehydrogenase/fumarate reductase-like Fe-S protein
MEKQMIKVTIKRFDPAKGGEPYLQDYEVGIEKGATVLSVFRDIYEQQDHSLALYYSCRLGKCAGCQVKVNGKVRLACTEVVTGDIVLEPQPGYAVVKDLYVDKGEKI